MRVDMIVCHVDCEVALTWSAWKEGHRKEVLRNYGVERLRNGRGRPLRRGRESV